MLIVLYKWLFYIYFIELVSFNTVLYPKASASASAGKSWPNGWRVRLVIERLQVRVSGQQELQVGGVNVQRSLSTFNTTTEVPLSKALNPQLLPGHRSNMAAHCSVCVFTAVCVHFGWVKCRAQIPSMGNRTWSYVTSLTFFCFYVQMFCWNHNTHWIQDGYIEAKQVERSQKRGTTLMCVLISES